MLPLCQLRPAAGIPADGEKPAFRRDKREKDERSLRLRLDGGRTRARTWDPLIKSQLLYQLSYAPGTGPEKGRYRRASFSKATLRCPASLWVFPTRGRPS
jgi:hypothetical protein